MKTAGLFPSAQAELHSDSKHHKKKKKKKAKRRHSSSSSSSSSDGNQWVEKPSGAAPPVASQPSAAPRRPSPAAAAPQRDAWMMVESVFAGVTTGEVRDRRRQTKQQAREAEERQRQADYEARKWREPSGTAAPSTPVGDGGASWLRRALERAKQQAADSGRPLEDVVADRWGSMEKLQSMLDAAEKRAAPAQPTAGERGARERGWRRGPERRRSGSRERKRSRSRERRRDRSRERRRSGSKERRRSRSRERRRSRSKERRRSRSKERRRSRSKEQRWSRSRSKSGETRRNRSKERRHGSNERGRDRSKEKRRSRSVDRKIDCYGKAKLPLRKGRDSSADSSDECRSGAASRDDKSRRGWRKPSTAVIPVPTPSSADIVTISKGSPQRDSVLHSASPAADTASEDDDQPEAAPEPVKPLTDGEMNALAAKILKAELNGDDDDVAALQKQLDAARQLRATGGAAARPADTAEKVVVVVGKGERAPTGAGERPNKRRKADTHRGGDRTKYFADDDRLNLRDMFERERRTTPADEAAALARLAGRGLRQARHHDDEHGLDEQLAERAGRAEPERAQDERAAARARAQHRHVERCTRCFDSRLTLRHMIAALGEKCYLALPAGRSLTEHHCLIVPQQHAVSLTALDEDGWAEMSRFRAALVAMFAASDQDVVFFESALKLRTHPHAVLHCVPMPRETGELAPIYFKKALEESETEWSQNKKVVDLRGRDVRRAVPKGLPYFFVDFGLQPGFAHVVEDEDLFPENFAQEVIGGMLELDPSAWRRSKNETLEQQRKKVMDFTKVWEPHDFTKDD